MASIGEEHEIRALFSELKLADEQTAPGFNAIWHRAQARSLRPRRAFNLSFAVATGAVDLRFGDAGILVHALATSRAGIGVGDYVCAGGFVRAPVRQVSKRGRHL